MGDTSVRSDTPASATPAGKGADVFTENKYETDALQQPYCLLHGGRGPAGGYRAPVDVSLRADVSPTVLPDPVIWPDGRAVSVAVSIRRSQTPDPRPDRPLHDSPSQAPDGEQRHHLLPYFAWANRGEGAMRVVNPPGGPAPRTKPRIGSNQRSAAASDTGLQLLHRGARR